MNRVIINAALTGCVHRKSDCPALPVTPAEIAEDARRVTALGAAMLHLHARDKHGEPTSDKKVYREIIRRVRDACGEAVIVVTTSGRKQPDISRRVEVLNLDGSDRPDMGSLTVGSLNFKDQASVNSPRDIEAILGAMAERGILPELEVFDTGMANSVSHYQRKGKLPGRIPYVNLLLGSPGTMPLSARGLLLLTELLPEETAWAVSGIGRFAFPAQRLGLALGGGVRVGLEDSLFMDLEKKIPADNPRLVERVRRLLDAMELRPATPAEVRADLGLRPAGRKTEKAGEE